MTARAGGNWRLKVAGRNYCFGLWADADGALREYLAVADSLQAGIAPWKHRAGVINVEVLFDRYLHAQRQRANAGLDSCRTWQPVRTT